MMKEVGYATLVIYTNEETPKMYLHIKGGNIASYDNRTTMRADRLWQRPSYAKKDARVWEDWHNTHEGIHPAVIRPVRVYTDENDFIVCTEYIEYL